MLNKSLLSSLIAALFFIALAPFLVAPPAHAYLDPGTGSFIVQTLFGLVLAAGVTMARFKEKVFSFFRPKTQTPKVDETSSSE